MSKNIHILTVYKPSRLFYDISIDKLVLATTSEISKWFDNKHIYITSDEEIKEGDWCLRNDILEKCNSGMHSFVLWGANAKKIILTTDPDLIKDGMQAINDEFLEWFIKNPSCNKVEVKHILEFLGDDYRRGGEQTLVYKIILPQEEPKQAPFLEADNIDGQWLSPIPEERAWQEENLKKTFENSPNAYPKWSYLNGLILLGLKRIEIINKKNQ